MPDAASADLHDVSAFKALCLKNPKWIRGGIAFEQRPNVWELLSGSRVYGGRLENPLNYYRALVKQSANIPSKQRKDIKADVPRTMQEHQKFKTKAAQAEMDRILSAYCVRNPTVSSANRPDGAARAACLRSNCSRLTRILCVSPLLRWAIANRCRTCVVF